MTGSFMGNQLALIRRELLEHRAIYVVPGVMAAIMVLAQITGHASVAAFDKEIDIALLGATNLGVNERGAVISVLLTVFSGFFAIGMLFVMVFYSLDALYAERKDRAILFWRSLPVTDAETVISKLVTALFVIPLVSLAAIAVTHLLVLLTTSFWVGMRGANAWHLIWEAVPLLDVWAATFIYALSLTLWLAPFFGWFLLASAYVKRAPTLFAILPLIVLPLLEKTILNSTLLFDAIVLRSKSVPIHKSFEFGTVLNEEMFKKAAAEGVSLVSMLDISRFLTDPSLWAGFIVCALFTTAAIYVRRFRDDS